MMTTILAAAGSSTELQRMLDKFVSPYVNSQNFSGAILVAHNGKVVFSQGYGMANLENAVAVIPETKFYIASVSKSFTAAAILLLQERGLLGVNDPVSRFIPDYPNGDKITIHQLLVHTAGLPRLVFFPDFMELSKQSYTTKQAVALFSDKPLAAQPGERSSYSNSNYVLLAYIIELVSGMNYGEFLKVNLLEPLEMSNTGHRTSSKELVTASGYDPLHINDLENSRYFDYSIFVGAGSLYSTTRDLYKWMAGIFWGGVLQPVSIEQMLTKHVGRRGYGWIITKEARKVIGLDGWSNTGFTSSLTYYPNENLTIVILSNINIRSVKSEILEGISAIFFGEAHSRLSLNPEPVEHALVKQIVGTYQFGEDFFIPHSRMNIVEQSGHLFVKDVFTQRLVGLLHLSELDFIQRSSWGRIKFQMDKAGKISGMLFSGKFKAEKLTTN